MGNSLILHIFKASNEMQYNCSKNEYHVDIQINTFTNIINYNPT